jgi:DNA-directed RNA polymerase specialized sigma24 family protein/outer membrane biosynthesis protein TonB
MADGSTDNEGGVVPPGRDFVVRRMSPPPPSSSRSRTADEYVHHRSAVLRALAARHRQLDADTRAELYHDAWTSVLKRRADGVEIEDLRSYLVGAASKLAAKKVYGADSRRRITFDPQESPFVAVADRSSTPEERVLADDEARRVRLMVDELGGVVGAVLKLRLDQGLEPREIREHLGLTDRQYRRAAERAAKALMQQFALFESDAWEKRRRSLLSACLMGIASERQAAKARRLVSEDPYSRALLGELRQVGERAAAMLPLPAAATGAPSGRVAELLAAAKEQLTDLVVGAKQNAASLAHRVTDPTPLAGARPGAAAAAVAGCLMAGGGTYCAVEGVPDPLVRPLGIEQQQARAEEKPPRTETQAAHPPPPVVTTPITEQAPPPPAPEPEPHPAPAEPPPAPEPAPPPPPPENEFEPTGATSASQAAPRPKPPRPAPPAGGGAGEFAP